MNHTFDAAIFLATALVQRYISSAYCSWYSTGGSIPGLLPQLSQEDLNATDSVGNTGNMFEVSSAVRECDNHFLPLTCFSFDAGLEILGFRSRVSGSQSERNLMQQLINAIPLRSAAGAGGEYEVSPVRRRKHEIANNVLQCNLSISGTSWLWLDKRKSCVSDVYCIVSAMMHRSHYAFFLLSRALQFGLQGMYMCSRASVNLLTLKYLDTGTTEVLSRSLLVQLSS